MSGGPIIIIDPKRFDFTSVMARASTWAGLLASAAGVSLLAYAAMPDRVQGLIPDWALGVLAALSVGVPFFNFLFTSYKQKGLGRATQVTVTTETKVEGDVTPEDATRIAESKAE
jgi:hypothetical protein